LSSRDRLNLTGIFIRNIKLGGGRQWIVALVGGQGVGFVSRKESNLQISIVVPHLGNECAFEDSLVSVLENRPDNVEIIVAHDGLYSDPFELGDEVRFVTHESRSLPRLIAAAASVARSRVVHVIGNGVKATEGWTEDAFAKFEYDDAGVVAPIAFDAEEEQIVAGGWTQTATRLMSPVAGRKTHLGKRDAASIRGVCLAASFWDREALQTVTSAFATDDLNAAQFAWPLMLRQSGWRCLLADESTVIADDSMLGLTSSLTLGKTLRAIHASLFNHSFVRSAMSVTIAGLFNVASPATLVETFGEALGVVLGSSVTRRLNPDAVQPPHQANESIRMPHPTTAPSLRRAA